MPKSFTLSHPAIDILCEELELDPAPFPFEIPWHGRTEPERDDIRAMVLAELEQRGLTFEGRTVDSLDEAVVLFAHPDIAVTLFGQLDQGTRVVARICSDGRRTIRATGQDDGVYFERLPGDSLISGALDLVPETSAGDGETVILPLEPEPRADEGMSAMVRTSRSRAAVRTHAAETLLAQAKLRFGQFRITVRHPDGGHEHGPDLFWFDTEAGRYVTYSSTTEDGRPATTIGPVDSPGLRRLLKSHLNQLIGD